MCVFLYNEIGSFFVVAGNFHYDRKNKKIHYDQKKKDKTSDGCAVLAIMTGKKRYSGLSGGLCCCVSFWFWWEIGSFFVVAGNFHYDRKKKVPVHYWKKKDTVVCLAGARSITTGKKKIQSSV